MRHKNLMQHPTQAHETSKFASYPILSRILNKKSKLSPLAPPSQYTFVLIQSLLLISTVPVQWQPCLAHRFSTSNFDPLSFHPIRNWEWEARCSREETGGVFVYATASSERVELAPSYADQWETTTVKRRAEPGIRERPAKMARKWVRREIEALPRFHPGYAVFSCSLLPNIVQL